MVWRYRAHTGMAQAGKKILCSYGDQGRKGYITDQPPPTHKSRVPGGWPCQVSTVRVHIFRANAGCLSRNKVMVHEYRCDGMYYSVVKIQDRHGLYYRQNRSVVTSI
jgi:hypothetical protein